MPWTSCQRIAGSPQKHKQPFTLTLAVRPLQRCPQGIHTENPPAGTQHISPTLNKHLCSKVKTFHYRQVSAHESFLFGSCWWNHHLDVCFPLTCPSTPLTQSFTIISHVPLLVSKLPFSSLQIHMSSNLSITTAIISNLICKHESLLDYYFLARSTCLFLPWAILLPSPLIEVVMVTENWFFHA